MATTANLATIQAWLGGLSPDSVPLLRGVGPEGLRILVGDSSFQEFEPGARLLIQGERREEVLIVLDGAVRVSLKIGGDERVLDELGPGTCLGEMSIVTGDPASATVTALSSCRVLRIGRLAFERALVEVPAVGRNLGVILAQRLRNTSRHRGAAVDGTFLPVVAPAGMARRARRFCDRLAASIARHTQRPVLFIDALDSLDGTGDGNAALGANVPRASASELPNLDALARDRSRLVEHERWTEQAGPAHRRIRGVLDGGHLVADDLIGSLCSLYRIVVVLLPPEAPPLPLSSVRARTVLAMLDDGDPNGERAAIAAARRIAGDAPKRLCLIQTGPPAATALTRRDEIALARSRSVDAEARIVHMPDQVARAENPNEGEAAGMSLARIARECSGLAVGVALGSGATRGFAHVGVLETLAASGVPIDCMAGTSIGAVVGALFALGHAPDEIMALLSETRRHILKLTFPTRSLLSNRGIRKHIERTAAGRSFEDCPYPFAAVAADLHDGARVALRTGPLAPAILASGSIPGVFPPVILDGLHLVDGGLCEPVPTTTVAELGAQVIIAVSLGVTRQRLPVESRKPYGVLGTLVRSTDIMQALVNDHTAVHSHVLIAPSLPQIEGGSLSAEFDLADQYRAAGQAAARAALPRLRSVLPWLDGA